MTTAPGAPAVAVVSYRASVKRRFGGAANAAGQSILINNLPFTVAGVTPPGFFGVDPARGAGRLSSDARQYSGGSRRAIRFSAPTLSRSELLLGRDHGPAASGSQPGPGSSRAGSRSFINGWRARPRTTRSARIFPTLVVDAGRGRAGQSAPAILEAALCAVDAGGIDPGAGVRQCGQSAAGARRGADGAKSRCG